MKTLLAGLLLVSVATGACAAPQSGTPRYGYIAMGTFDGGVYGWLATWLLCAASTSRVRCDRLAWFGAAAGTAGAAYGLLATEEPAEVGDWVGISVLFGLGVVVTRALTHRSDGSPPRRLRNDDRLWEATFLDEAAAASFLRGVQANMLDPATCLVSEEWVYEAMDSRDPRPEFGPFEFPKGKLCKVEPTDGGWVVTFRARRQI